MQTSIKVGFQDIEDKGIEDKSQIMI